LTRRQTDRLTVCRNITLAWLWLNSVESRESLQLLWDSRFSWRRGWRRSPHCCKSLHNNAALNVRQSPASKNENTEVERPTALEAVTRRQPGKIQQTEKVRTVVTCRVCESAVALELLVVTICKCSRNPITNPNPVYSHSVTWQYVSSNILRRALRFSYRNNNMLMSWQIKEK
jgi:hypothetical protein